MKKKKKPRCHLEPKPTAPPAIAKRLPARSRFGEGSADREGG